MNKKLPVMRLLHTTSRLLFNFLTLLSLALLAGIVAAWADSYRGMRSVETSRDTHVLQWTSREGVAVIYWHRGIDGEFRWQRPTQRFQVLGLAYADGRLARRKPWSMLIVPYWMPAVICAILPVTWSLRRHRLAVRRERLDAGLCPACGQSVCESPGRCPQCDRSA